MQAILGEWDSAPQAVKSEEGGVELIRVIRKIAQMKEQLRIIAAIPQKNIKKMFEIAKNTFRNLKRKETDL